MQFTNKQLRNLIIPLIIEQLLSVMVGMADSIMVASAGEAAVSAVSLVDTIMILIINIFAALATGGAVVAGQYIGQRKPEKGCEATDQLMLFITVFSVFVTLLVYTLQNVILRGVFGKIEPDVMANARIYLLIVTASIPFIALYNGGAAIFRAMGNSKVSMETSLLMNGINIAGNAVLIYGFRLGVAGAAIPTLVSRIFAAMVMLLLVRSQKHPIHMSARLNLRFDKMMIQKILHIGIPNGLENSMFQLGKILVLSLVSTFGTASIAANAVSNAIATFQVLPGMAMGMAILTVVSQCVGAGDYRQVRYYTKKLMQLVYVAMAAVNILVYFLLPFILKAYSLSPETAALTRRILLYHSACAVTIWPLAFSLPNALRAANDVKITMLISVFSMWIFRIVFSYILGEFLGLGVFGVWVAMTIDWLFRAVCFTIRFLRGKWQHIVL